ncbi:uncharacterized protein LOC120144682 [Hibiscus syriacus]|uniref:uncharacterized protein LOC120144682 n=1 Tax=Hibiscus syriacus TaxID=106335 RepID=UPI00192484BC|nr:uncharacterized protein LOC120144682 [Hibiscus syriacus]
MSVKRWLNQKIVDPMVQILKKGAEPKQLAFSVALGFTLGGVRWYCGIAIAVLGSLANAPAIVLANFLATPMEVSLMVSFLRFGGALTGGEAFELTSDALNKVIIGQASTELLFSIARALLGWFVAAPIILVTLYLIFLPIFKFLVPKFSTSPQQKDHLS